MNETTTPTTAEAPAAEAPEVRTSAPTPDDGKADAKANAPGEPPCQCIVCRVRRMIETELPNVKVQSFAATLAVAARLVNLVREVRELASYRTTGSKGLDFADEADELTKELQETYKSGLSDALAGLSAAAGALTVLSTVRTADAAIEAAGRRAM